MTTPKDYILQSFNALDKTLASDPRTITDRLIDIRANRNSSHNDSLFTQTSSDRADKKLTRCESYADLVSKTACTYGLSGSYAGYSASVEVSNSKVTKETSSKIYYLYSVEVAKGTASFSAGANTDAIRSGLCKEVLESLEKVDGWAGAQDFSNKYGTHIILRVNLGGMANVTSSFTADSRSDTSSTDGKVQVGYSSCGGDLKSVCQASISLETSLKVSHFQSSISCSGGDATKSPDSVDESGVSEWVESCGVDTVYAVGQTIEFWQIAQSLVSQRALKNYVYGSMLKQSIENPVVISNTIVVQPYRLNSAVVSLPLSDDESRLKIIGGGASINPGGDSEFLCSSFPMVDSAGRISGWAVNSHDIGVPSDSGDTLTAYAMAINDPMDLLEVKVFSKQGENPAKGKDAATAILPTDLALCGGGAKVDIGGSGNVPKFLISSYPVEGGWTAEVIDYGAAANHTSLNVYAIGIRCDILDIRNYGSQNTSGEAVQHGNVSAAAPDRIAGGGVWVNIPVGSNPNLMQQSYPSDGSSWCELNKDTDDNASFANVTCYAFSLQADPK